MNLIKPYKKKEKKMKLIFSSFLVGVAVSGSISFQISEKIRERRLMYIHIDRKKDEELESLVYQQVSYLNFICHR